VTSSASRDVERLELAIGRVLKVGSVASTACFAAGLILTIVGRDTLAGALLPAGLWILMATPATRVIVSVMEYIRERDWLFVALTLTVLLALAASVLAAMG
jgi:uncharacterized membrane protein